MYVRVSPGVTACSRQCRRAAVGARVTAQVMILIKRMHAIAHHLHLYYLMTLFLEACKPQSWSLSPESTSAPIGNTSLSRLLTY